MLTLRYTDARRGARLAAWRLSIGIGVAKCKSRALFLANAAAPRRSHSRTRARRATRCRPGAAHPHRLRDSQFAAPEAAGARGLVVPPAQRARGGARP